MAESEGEEELAELTLPVDINLDHIQGKPGSRVTLVEYGDYECPHCGQHYRIVKEIEKRLMIEVCLP